MPGCASQAASPRLQRHESVLTGSDVLAMTLDTMAQHLADKFGGTAMRRSARTACIDLTGVDSEQLAQLRQQINQSASDLKFDFAFLRKEQRWQNFSVLACDMDSTLISIECIDEIADLYGKKAEVSAITEAAMRGEISDFAESLRARVALLEGAPESLLRSVYDQRLALTAGAEQLLETARSHHLRTLMVSGGFTFFTDRLKARLAIDSAFSNTLAVSAATLTGKLEGPVFGAADKRDALVELCGTLDVPTSRAIAIGDGANDVPMMSVAGLSVAFHGKPKVVAAADIAIRYGSLEVLLEWL